MLELEALLLGLEPLTAAGIGLGALALAPVVGVVGSAMGGSNSAVGNSLSESSKSLAKTGMVWMLDAYEKAQSTVAETSESFQDLVAEAKTELKKSKSKPDQNSIPHQVEIG